MLLLMTRVAFGFHSARPLIAMAMLTLSPELAQFSGRILVVVATP